ncbi:hypothetical protein [uncultured Methanobrevibacter sp.]|nr:hypothetical protein [uncultured Methanobrevibacter sp.]
MVYVEVYFSYSDWVSVLVYYFDFVSVMKIIFCYVGCDDFIGFLVCVVC